MTVTDQVPQPARGSTAAGGDRSIALLLASGALLVVVVVLVLLFGIARPPALTMLADQPNPAPTASVAWTDYDHDGNETCVYIARPDGTTDELLCEQQLGEVLAWDADGIIVRSWGPRDELLWLDAQTGDRIRNEIVDEQGWIDVPRDAFVRTTHRDGELTVTLEDGPVLWQVDAHNSYTVNEGQRSPDGAWVAMFDSASRLLVVPADGSAEPRVWTDDAVSWEFPIWEGTEVTYTDESSS